MGKLRRVKEIAMSARDKNVFYIGLKAPKGADDAELLAWLQAFLKSFDEHQFIFDDEQGNANAHDDDGPLDENGDPTEIAELEYLDTLVTGDDHPEALEMIMSAYRKHSGKV